MVMIDHVGITVTDLEKSKAFYSRALAPLGYELLREMLSDTAEAAGFGVPPKPDFWIATGSPSSSPVHVAFRATSRTLFDRKGLVVPSRFF